MLSKIVRYCGIAVVIAGLASGGTALAAGENTLSETGNASMEMPVLTGTQWRSLDQESKIAFIWGVGHVVTIEEHVVQRHPELKRADFTAKLAEGLRGMPMNSIIQQVDSYYQANPLDNDWPVMRVIWREIVKPKLKTGIADAPLEQNVQPTSP
ncbi:MAG TPA: hypothetical protein VJ550_09335 [Geomonas sp.]|nr:hypothetical protein [Geomonas sp.]